LKIVMTSMLVDDQAKALTFYRDVLGFEPKLDIPMGEHRWPTLTSPGDSEGVQLVLEPDAHPVKPFKDALLADGIPYTSFVVEATAMGPVTTAVFDDTCGNLIQITQRR
jgi:catechol 2,3-dioxygenase-like lactoylglutathione lyase family enzyme